MRTVRQRRPIRWGPVLGYDGLYDVADFGGQMRSHYHGGRLMKTTPRGRLGHRSVYLYKDGVRVNRYVHQLVLETHGPGPCPPGLIACHGVYGQEDDRIENLRWDTYTSNIQDTIQDVTWTRPSGGGHAVRGERHGISKLTEREAREILARHAAGEIRTRTNPSGKPQGEVAAEYGVDKTIISKIIRGKNWAWLPRP